MNEFELFTMIFYTVAAYYEKKPSDELAVFLGGMSPFTFKEVDSADSAVFAGFRRFINGRKISLENSLMLAREYAGELDYHEISTIMNGVTEERWEAGCKDYLSRPHKGMGKE